MNNPHAPALARHFGYRGAALIVLGGMWTLFGVSVLFQPPEGRSWVLHEMIPDPIRVALWAGTGAVAAFYGVRGAHRDDTIGMAALMVMPLVRFASFAFSYLVWLATNGAHEVWPTVAVTGYGGGWYSASVWALIVGLVRVLSGWPNPRRVLPLDTRED